MVEPDTVTETPNRSPAAASSATSFAACAHSPSSLFSNTYAEPDFEPASSS